MASFSISSRRSSPCLLRWICSHIRCATQSYQRLSTSTPDPEKFPAGVPLVSAWWDVLLSARLVALRRGAGERGRDPLCGSLNLLDQGGLPTRAQDLVRQPAHGHGRQAASLVVEDRGADRRDADGVGLRADRVAVGAHALDQGVELAESARRARGERELPPPAPARTHASVGAPRDPRRQAGRWGRRPRATAGSRRTAVRRPGPRVRRCARRTPRRAHAAPSGTPSSRCHSAALGEQAEPGGARTPARRLPGRAAPVAAPARTALVEVSPRPSPSAASSRAGGRWWSGAPRSPVRAPRPSAVP